MEKPATRHEQVAPRVDRRGFFQQLTANAQRNLSDDPAVPPTDRRICRPKLVILSSFQDLLPQENI